MPFHTGLTDYFCFCDLKGIIPTQTLIPAKKTPTEPLFSPCPKESGDCMIEPVMSGIIKKRVHEPDHDMTMNLCHDAYLVGYECYNI